MAAGDDTGVRVVRTDVLRESERTRVTRVQSPAGSVICKESLGPGGPARLDHERAVLERMSGLPGVSRLASVEAAAWRPEALVLQDVGGIPLTQEATPLGVAEVTRVAVGLAEVVAAVHRRGVMHRDINPANILLAGPGRDPYLIDFALATTFAEFRPEFAHPLEIVGTLAYLAPEQTGRTGRPVDQRADLYALGATIYELATGTPPFGTGDPLRLIRDHLTRVPVAPVDLMPALPAALSEIIMHLLEKEPDNRYQTADGLIHDLALLRQRRPDQRATSMHLGTRDFPLRLVPPSRPVGRDDEIAALGTAFIEAVSGRCRGVLVSGEPGVGKTSLIDELRPIVTASDGWFVSGKFDQYRRDQEFDGVRQAFRSLGRLLLAEPEEDLADLRERILTACGANAGLATAVLPEFATLLKVPPNLGDPLTAQVRGCRNGVQILRAVASRKRPVVLVIDDLQWAGRTPLGFLDMLLNEDGLDGLLVVGAYRDTELDATHPLAALLNRWRRDEAGPQQLALTGLPPTNLAAMVGEMLRLDPDRATQLAAMIAPRTRGNPYETVELLNALRRDDVLTPRHDGWQWDATAVQRIVRAEATGLFGQRADAMPAPTRAMLEVMACIGGRVDVDLMRDATELSPTTLDERLAPALEDGLLIMEPGGQDALRFRHDRVREAVVRRLGARRQRALHLRLGRRLGRRPELFAVAAQQYLPVTDAVRDQQERHHVAGLLDRAAEQAQLLSNYPMVERLLTAAVRLTDAADTATLIKRNTGRHQALYSIGRLDEADEVYETICRLSRAPAERADATLVQVSSLSNRNRPQEGVNLGLELLRQLGVAVPTPERRGAEIGRGIDNLYRWLDQTTVDDDLRRPDITDPLLLATCALINRIMPAAFFCDQATMAWLSLEAARMWATHGPGRTLVGPICHVAFVTIALRDDYRIGYRLMQRVLAVGEARGYEPDTSQARFLNAMVEGLWFEPLEETVRQAERAREGLLQGGDLQNACYSYYVPVNAVPRLRTDAGGLRGRNRSSACFRRTNRKQPDGGDVCRRPSIGSRAAS